MNYCYALLLILNIQSIAFSFKDKEPLQADTNRFVFLPSGLLFSPLKANVHEPRIGLMKFTDTEEMRVDVGNSIDLFSYSFAASSTELRAGIDFFAYALTTGAQGLRLQIDAVDGFFGGNFSFRHTEESAKNMARLRILHRSAHLVDGHYLTSTKSWIDNIEPIPYTQDFGELVLSRTQAFATATIRTYAGISYAVLVRPNEIERFSYLAGAELSSGTLLGKVAGSTTNMYVAYHLALTGEPAYHATHQLQAGVKFGEMDAKGVSVFVAYYNGTHMLGEYFNKRLETVGAGFSVEFF